MADQSAQLGQSILDLLAGVKFETAVAAQLSAFATIIGATFHASGRSRDEAERQVRAFADDVSRHVREHWGAIDSEVPTHDRA